MTNTAYSYKNIWKIAYPIILGSLAQDLITVIDTIFLGKLGEVALGASAIGGIFYLSIVMIGWGFGIGVQIIIARRYGEGEFKTINKTLFHSFFILMSLAIAAFGLVRMFTSDILSHILSSPFIIQEGGNFINVRIFGIFAAFTNIVFRSFYIGTANTKIISYSTIVMAIANIGLDYLLIFGIGVFPELGIKGAALASVIAELIATLYFIIYTFRSKNLQKFNLFNIEKFEWSRTKKILAISTPTMFQNFIAFAAWFVFFVFVEKMGEQELAISNIIRSIYIILLLPIMGFASATNSLVSYSIGQNNYKPVKTITIRSIIMAFIGISAIVFTTALIPEKVIGVFTNSPEMVEATLPVFYVIMFASYTLALGMILFQAVSGTGNTISALLIETTTIGIYLFGIYLLVESDTQNIEQIWKMEFLYGMGLAIFSVAYLRFGKWKNKKI